MSIISTIRDYAIEICEQKYPTKAEAAQLIRQQIDLLNDPGQWKRDPSEIRETTHKSIINFFSSKNKGVDCRMKEYKGENDCNWAQNPRFIATKVMRRVAEILGSQDQEAFNATDFMDVIGGLVINEVQKVVPVKQEHIQVLDGSDSDELGNDSQEVEEPISINNKKVQILMQNIMIADEIQKEVLSIIEEVGVLQILDEAVSRENMNQLSTIALIKAASSKSAKEIIAENPL